MQRLSRFLGTKVSKPERIRSFKQSLKVLPWRLDFLFPFLRGRKKIFFFFWNYFKGTSVGEHVCE